MRPVVEDVLVSPVFPVEDSPKVEALPVAESESVETPSEEPDVESVEVPPDVPVIPVALPVDKFPPEDVSVLPDAKLLDPVEPKFDVFCLTRKRFSTFVTPETSSVISSAIRLA